ncbi:MAG: rod-binding protein [Paracoccaceae bacterium]|uniref:rod-binding protein n=1 Tax=Seohaeicola saemankumensis TaxID=481181 RepID=UPI001E4FDBC5|nr:rod-binding protein [Seohaeicola saemankumensis]MCD1625053.1 rod-binding protein [Seohaeicola saemankumensis]
MSDGLSPFTLNVDPPQKTGKPAKDPLRETAEKLEASFLSEMLKHAGLGKTRQEFGGGAGEDQFASLLRDTQANEMVKSGGIGLAETIYLALKDQQNG